MKPATEIESEPIEIPRLGYHAYVGINRIVGSGEGWITELSTDQLREVVALSADAVGED